MYVCRIIYIYAYVDMYKNIKMYARMYIYWACPPVTQGWQPNTFLHQLAVRIASFIFALALSLLFHFYFSL